MFSFDPIKTITCIDGGALVVRSIEEQERLHRLRLIGMGQPAEVMYQNRRAWTYDVVEPGYRYHLANLHAALGLEQAVRAAAKAARDRDQAVRAARHEAAQARSTTTASTAIFLALQFNLPCYR